MARHQYIVGIVSGIVLSLLMIAVVELNNNSPQYATSQYRTVIPDIRVEVQGNTSGTKKHKSKDANTKIRADYESDDTEEEEERQSSTASSSSTSESTTTPEVTTTPATSTTSPAGTTTTALPPDLDATEMDTLEAKCMQLQKAKDIAQNQMRPTYAPLPTIAGLLPYHSKNHQEEDDAIAGFLYKQVRVLCWVMTSPEGLIEKGIHTYHTWGHRCNKILYISTKENSSFPAPVIKVDVEEGREHLTAKTMLAFKYVYDNHYEDADWFMKADDDTFVILENLRYFLSDRNPMDPVYYGHHFSAVVEPQGYYSGGGGYVLSKEALKRFALKGFGKEDWCRSDGGAEDAEFGKCMQHLGVHTAESNDERGRSRFHGLDPENMLSGTFSDWYHDYDSHGAKYGEDSISDYPISFHYMTPKDMYEYVFYLYHLKVYGINSRSYPDIHKHYLTIRGDKKGTN